MNRNVKTRFTHAPWKVVDGVFIVDKYGFAIASTKPREVKGEETANAALLEETPELYAALQEAASELCSNYACEPCP